MAYKYHSFDLQKGAAQLLREISKPESVDDFTYRRLAHVEFHPLLDQLSYVWFWSASRCSSLILRLVRIITPFLTQNSAENAPRADIKRAPVCPASSFEYQEDICFTVFGGTQARLCRRGLAPFTITWGTYGRFSSAENWLQTSRTV